MVFAFAGILAALTVAAGVATWRVDRRLAATGELLLRSELRLAELRRVHEGQLDLEDAQLLVEGGTRMVQGVHRGIASIPFAILEAIPPTRPATVVVRVAHDLIAGSVYGAISLVNRGVGRALRGTAADPRPKKP